MVETKTITEILTKESYLCHSCSEYFEDIKDHLENRNYCNDSCYWYERRIFDKIKEENPSLGWNKYLEFYRKIKYEIIEEEKLVTKCEFCDEYFKDLKKHQKLSGGCQYKQRILKTKKNVEIAKSYLDMYIDALNKQDFEMADQLRVRINQMIKVNENDCDVNEIESDDEDNISDLENDE